MKKKDEINWSKCMKKKCELCNRINYCFRYRGDGNGERNNGRTNREHKETNNRSG